MLPRVLIVLALSLATTVSLAAQDPASIDDLRLRLERLSSDTSLGEEQQSAIDGLLQKTQTELERWADFAAQLEAAEAQRSTAPDELRRLREELAQPAAEESFSVLEIADLETSRWELSESQVKLESVRSELEELEETILRHTRNRANGPRRLAVARRRSDELGRQSELSAPPREPQAETEAREIYTAAALAAVEAEIAMLEAQPRGAEVFAELLSLRREAILKTLARVEARVAELQKLENERRREHAEEAARLAREAVQQAHPAVQGLADVNRELAEQRTGPSSVASRIADAAAALREIQVALELLEVEAREARERFETLGPKPSVGLALRTKEAQLPQVRSHKLSISALHDEVQREHLELFDFREQRLSLAQNLDEQVASVMDGLRASVVLEDQERVEDAVDSLLRARLQLLDDLIADHQTLFSTMVESEALEQHLIDELEDFRSYLRARMVWIPDGAPLGLGVIGDARLSLAWLIDRRQWGAALVAGGGALAQRPLQGIFTTLLLGGLLLAGSKIAASVRKSARGLATGESGRKLADGVLGSLLLAGRAPAALASAGWFLSVAADAPPVAVAMGHSFLTFSWPLFLIELIRSLAMKGGLGERVLGWQEQITPLLSQAAARTSSFVLPCACVAMSLLTHFETTHQRWAQTGSRSALIVGLIALAGVIYRVIVPGTPGGGVSNLSPAIRLPNRVRPILGGLAVLLPLAFAALSVAGFTRTSMDFARTTAGTGWVVLGFMLVLALVRWGTSSGDGETLPDGTTAKPQALRMLQWTAVVVAALVLWRLWLPLLPALRILDTAELWVVETATGTAAVTLQSLLVAALVLVVSLVVARNAPGTLLVLLSDRLGVEKGTGYAVSILVRYLAIAVGIGAALSLVGIGWSRLQWLLAGLSVGLGIGLQETFSNFFSGLVLLFERPLRVGDVVTVGDVHGRVTKIRIRATTILDWDNKELIVPNKDLVIGKLINWSLSDTELRVQIRVGVAYGSDTEEVERRLLRVAKDEPLVLPEPPSQVVFESFGESSLDFRIDTFIGHQSQLIEATHRLHMAVDRAFREAGIEIAFPQRDLHLDAAVPLPVTVVGDSDDDA